MAHVQIDRVSKVYPGNVKAVDDISLTVHDQEFLVLVGPSGCGKSTTLRMIAGLEEITDGTISIGDKVVNDVPPKNRDIAMVFQNYALYPHMTVYKNMAFGLKLRKFPKKEIDDRVRHAAKILGITPLLDRKPKALSGGQRQRVALGRAIVRDPAAFLFDEPLSNLDAKLRVETRAELKRLHKRLQTTTVYVTHDQEEAMTLGDRVVVMSDGLIQQVAPPLEIYNHPVNRFVAAFLGTPPMNFIDGKLSDEGGMLAFESAGGVRVRLNSEQSRRVGRFANRDVVLGLRPEGLLLRPAEGQAGDATPTVRLRVDVVEPLGNTMDVYATLPGTEQADVPASGTHLVARVKAQPLEEGEEANFHVDLEKVHVFEVGEYGRNLTLPDTEADEPAAERAALGV